MLTVEITKSVLQDKDFFMSVTCIKAHKNEIVVGSLLYNFILRCECKEVLIFCLKGSSVLF